MSMTMALEWTWAGPFILDIFLFPVAGVACACKKEAQRSKSMDVPETRGHCVGVGRVLLRMSKTIVAIESGWISETTAGAALVIS